VHPPPEARVLPGLGASNKVRPECVPLDIANDLVKVLIAFDRERLLAALIEMAVSHAAPGHLPVARVGDGQLLHEGAEIAIMLRPQHHVPVVRHQRVGQNPHRTRFERPFENPLEGFEVGALEEQPHPAHAAIQDMEQHPPGAKRAVLGMRRV
jgi:hypothetical protein